jgi:hypothetical protein
MHPRLPFRGPRYARSCNMQNSHTNIKNKHFILKSTHFFLKVWPCFYFIIKTYLMINVRFWHQSSYFKWEKSQYFPLWFEASCSHFPWCNFYHKICHCWINLKAKIIKEKTIVTSQICVYFNNNNLNVEEFQPQLLKFKSW